MSLVGFKANNHPQQISRRGPKEHVDGLSTSQEFFYGMEARFGSFSIDVAASEINAKVRKFYSKEDNGLNHSWALEKVWCNPPYSDIAPWVKKAWAETAGCPLIVMLLPANRTEQRWWQEEVGPWRDGKSNLEVEFLPGRLRFIKHGSSSVMANERPPFGCCLLIWRWDMRQKKTREMDAKPDIPVALEFEQLVNQRNSLQQQVTQQAATIQRMELEREQINQKRRNNMNSFDRRSAAINAWEQEHPGLYPWVSYPGLEKIDSMRAVANQLEEFATPRRLDWPIDVLTEEEKKPLLHVAEVLREAANKRYQTLVEGSKNLKPGIYGWREYIAYEEAKESAASKEPERKN